MSHLNGLLLPSSENNLKDSRFAEAANILIERAIVLNQGHRSYFPVWGTGLGFQKLLHFYANHTDWLTYCQVENVSLRLYVAPDMDRKSRLFRRSNYSQYIWQVSAQQCEFGMQ